jgi:hypothetical protein
MRRAQFRFFKCQRQFLDWGMWPIGLLVFNAGWPTTCEGAMILSLFIFPYENSRRFEAGRQV